MAFSTQRDVDKLTLPPGKKDAFYFDKACRGLSVRLQGTRRSWVVHYAIDGKRRRLDLGDVAGLPLKDARTRAAEIAGQAKKGTDPLAERQARAGRERRTFKALVDRYLIQHAERHLRPRSLVEMRRGLLVHLAPLHDIELDKITRRDLAERFGALVDSSGPITANRVRGMASACFAWAVTQGLMETNPVVGTARPALEQSRDRVLTTDEIRLLWRATDGGNAYGTICRLLLLTAQRREEVAGMRWDELDLGKAIWSIPGIRAKNGRAHDVPLSSQVVTILKAIPRQEGFGFLFGRRNTPFSGYSGGKQRLDQRMAQIRAETRLGRPLQDSEAPKLLTVCQPGHCMTLDERR